MQGSKINQHKSQSLRSPSSLESLSMREKEKKKNHYSSPPNATIPEKGFFMHGFTSRTHKRMRRNLWSGDTWKRDVQILLQSLDMLINMAVSLAGTWMLSYLCTSASAASHTGSAGHASALLTVVSMLSLKESASWICSGATLTWIGKWSQGYALMISNPCLATSYPESMHDDGFRREGRHPSASALYASKSSHTYTLQMGSHNPNVQFACSQWSLEDNSAKREACESCSMGSSICWGQDAYYYAKVFYEYMPLVWVVLIWAIIIIVWSVCLG